MFSVTAAGTPAPTYQWNLSGTSIAGATGASYTISNVQSSNAGAYTVTVTNSVSSVTSNAATLTVTPGAVTSVAPTITSQPASVTVAAGSAAIFSVTATGTPAPTYQWKQNNAPISGATGASYTISTAQSSNSGAQYTVTVTNTAGSVTSNAATLTVTSAPTITTQPVNVTVAAGSSAMFSVTATGTPAPTYQWKQNNAPISGATGASYTISSVQSSGNGALYTVTVTNSVGSVTSTAATLTVTSAPTITTQPANVTVAAGSAAMFSVTATGVPAPTYQWKQNGTPIAGATGASYVLSNAQSSNNGALYTVTVTNSVSSVTSTAATLTVTSAATITTQPVNVIVVAGSPAIFTVTAAGLPTPTYQWQRNVGGTFTNITGATGTSYTVSSPAAADDLAQFQVVVSNSGGSVTSQTAVLAVNHTLSVVAGQLGGVGNIDGPGSAAAFYQPEGAAVDTVHNLIYIADTSNHTIRKITAAGVVTTFAGTAHIFGFADGTGTAALFNNPQALAVDGNGNVYVADTGNDAVRMITPGGAVTTLAGAGYPGSNDGTGMAALFNSPKGIAVNSAGTLIYVADTNNSTIRAVTPGGQVTTYAGAAGQSAYLDVASTPTNARFYGPGDVALDASGNLYIADTQNSVIRMITSAGAVTTLAGTQGQFGHADGAGANAVFDGPNALTVDPLGVNLYVADSGSNTIRAVVISTQTVTTLAGTAGASGFSNGTGSAASFFAPSGIATDGTTVYVADEAISLIRSITISSAAVQTFAGNIGGRGYVDALVGTNAKFDNSHGVGTDPVGNIYVADWYNNVIRMISPSGSVSTLAGQPGVAGSMDGAGAGAQFNGPRSIVVDSFGNLYIADTGNDTIRKITMPGASVTTVAGIAGSAGNTNGALGTNTFGQPTGVSIDSSNNVYIADFRNNSIRMLSTSGITSGMVTTVAGSTTGAGGSANGTLLSATFQGPRGVVVDPNQSGVVLYVADRDNEMIRKVDVTNNLVSTVAGSAFNVGYLDATIGTNALFNWPVSIAIDSSDNLYVCDANNNAIRMITPAGAVSTVAGTYGTLGVVVGNLPGSMSAPSSIAVIGGTGTNLRLAVADSVENSILRIALP
jgi:DNA-binding beta-propeller fold protein YncE